ncbi:MAG: lamin tail domain-containing protein, partial [Bacteroidia bacterium]|nr:lamin tail domain-containing protein [Bacteroidia bacterium]
VLSSGSGGADAFYGITSLHWTGSLSNSGEAVVLIDSYGQIVDSVKYGIASPWPTAANGSGASLEFCFPNLDNSIAANWTASTSFIDTISTGQAIYASPGTNCITPEPTRLKIISINNGFSPIIDTPFDVVVHAQDNFGVDANALSDVNITLNLATGTGVLGGTLTGTIAAGTNAVTISGVTYNIAESGVSIFVTDDSSALSADTSNIFTVLGSPPVPAKLSIVSVNNGTDPVINTLFDVVIEVRDSADSPVAISSEVSITLSLASGTGVLGGTTTGTVSTGNSSITISGINYNVAEAGVSIVASDDSLILAPDTSALFDVLETPPVPAIIITEIMYNPPESVTDSLEFLELYNNDIIPVDMTGYNFSAGVTYIFGALTLNPGEYIVLSSGSGGADAFYGTTSLHWTGALSNSGEAIVLIDSYGQIVDSVYYDDSNPWPTAANGNGSSLTLCNPSADNSLPDNWSASTEYVDTVAGIEVYASPGTGCTISFPTGLKVISVNGNIDPYVNIPFDIIVQAIDSTGQPAIVNSPVFVDLSVASGNGLLGGLFTGIITTGNSTVNFNGITYNLAEDSVIIRASDQNYVLASGLSESFNVVELPPTAKIVITEIMYNPPESSNDSLEFIELYNNDTLPVDMTGYSVLSSGSGGADAFYGITSLHWTGSLSNSGEAVVLIDSYGQIVDSVKYGITSPWPDANENGYSIEFCYPYMDNTVPANWSQATNYVDTVAGMSVYASPGQGCNIPVPEKLAIILVNNNVNPIVNVPFNVVVQSQDIDGNAINSISNINIGLSLVTGSGNLGGTLNGTVTAGTNSVVISGVIYDMVDTAVSIMAIDITAVLDTGISYLFDVTAPPPPPVKLVITSVNGGIDPNVNTPFNVVVQTRDSSDNLSNVIQNTTVVLSLVTGSGTLGGTLTGTLNTGNNTLMLSGVTYNIEDINVSILASDQSGNLLAGTSGYFNVIDASSVLSPGDIAIIQFRSDPADGFAFVALDNIPGNTEIKFTDKGWTEADTLSSGENTLIWTCPAGGILPGTVVTWQVTTGVNLGSVTGSLDGIDDTGDQILVYQGSSGNPAFIYALSTVPWTLSGSISDPYHSYLPDSLQNKYTAIHFSGADNGYYKLTPISGTPEELKHSISDTINWFTTNNSSVEFFKPASYWSFIIGIKEFSIGNQLIKLYPNPAENFIIIENIPEKEILQIIDVNGIVHYTEIINSERILVNIQRFGKSIYLARIIMESGEYMNLRFVKY